MERMIHITSPAHLSSFMGTNSVTLINEDDLTGHGPDAHWLLAESDGTAIARCSLWWQSAPNFSGHKLGLIGHYAARDQQSAEKLLNHACRELHRRGCNLAVGPLDGSTWRRYRFISNRGLEPPFFLEPDNPDDYPGHFTATGFSPMAHYYSSLVDDLEQVPPFPEALQKAVNQSGITVRSLDPSDFSGELTRIFDLSIAGFSGNFLYTPIIKEAFFEMYDKIRPITKPELVLFALHEHKPVGFLFALPDMLRPQRGEALDTMIVKSMAVLPEWNGKGVGAKLLAMVVENAKAMGFKRAIHALMYENNRSRNLSKHSGTQIRQYTLYSRELR